MRGNALRVMSGLAGALIVASLATGWIPAQPDPAEPASSGEANANASESHGLADQAHDAQDADESSPSPELVAHQPRHDHALSDGKGQIPTRAEAGELEHQLEEFVVESNEGLAEMDERGYLEGAGTIEDPYVIDEFRVTEDLTIKDVSKPLVIKNSYLEGQLTLNFAGEQVYVHHNNVHDLRVNENVQRDGPTTAGLFEHNEIGVIGQIRHFGGEFAHNEIGPKPDDIVEEYLSDTGVAQLPDEVVWNFDGYHGAHVHNNTAIGRVDVQLHGHFHASCVSCEAHDHADPGQFPEDNTEDSREPDSPHSYRFHTLDFENNTVRAPQASQPLRFDDEGHAGDDRTANSEPNAHLEDRHEHHQYVRAHANEVHGGPLAFDIVNAEDPRHDGLVQEALVDLTDNEVVQERPRDVDHVVPAYRIHAADNVEIHASGNAYEFQGDDSAKPAGYRWATDGDPADTTGFVLTDVAASQVEVAHTQGSNATYGVTLHAVDETPVQLEANSFDASEEDRHEA